MHMSWILRRASVVLSTCSRKCVEGAPSLSALLWSQSLPPAGSYHSQSKKKSLPLHHNQQLPICSFFSQSQVPSRRPFNNYSLNSVGKNFADRRTNFNDIKSRDPGGWRVSEFRRHWEGVLEEYGVPEPIWSVRWIMEHVLQRRGQEPSESHATSESDHVMHSRSKKMVSPFIKLLHATCDVNSANLTSLSHFSVFMQVGPYIHQHLPFQ